MKDVDVQMPSGWDDAAYSTMERAHLVAFAVRLYLTIKGLASLNGAISDAAARADALLNASSAELAALNESIDAACRKVVRELSAIALAELAQDAALDAKSEAQSDKNSLIKKAFSVLARSSSVQKIEEAIQKAGIAQIAFDLHHYAYVALDELSAESPAIRTGLGKTPSATKEKFLLNDDALFVFFDAHEEWSSMQIYHAINDAYLAWVE